MEEPTGRSWMNPRKEITYAETRDSPDKIGKMGKQSFYTYNLKGQVEFGVNIDVKEAGSTDPTALVLCGT